MKKSTKLQIGARLFFACLILFVGGKVAPLAAAVLAGIVLSLPAFKFSSFHKMILGEGFTAEQTTELKELLKGVADKNKELVKTEMETAVNGLMKTSELEAKFTAMGLTDKTIKELTTAVEKQGEELRKVFEAPKGATKSFDQYIEEKAKEIVKIGTGEITRLKIEIPKIQKTTVLTTANADSTLAHRLTDVGELAYAGSKLAALFRKATLGPNSGGTLRYFDQTTVTRNAAGKDENTQYAESVIDWTEYSISAVKITDSIPVTKEAFNDFGHIKGELDRLMNINMVLKEDQQLYAGTGVAPQLKGINVYATDKQAVVIAAPYAATVDNANVYDLIAVLRVVLTTSKQSKYMPNVVLMNPVDILKFKLKKASDGHYILPPFIAMNGMVIDSISVVETNQVTANTLTIGDFRYGTIWEAQGLEIEMGLIDKQFVQDAMTIKASKRELLLVRTADLDAFAKLTDITAAVAALETP